MTLKLKMMPLDQRMACVLVRPLARTGVTPNQVTTLTLVVALSGAGLLATGGAAAAAALISLFLNLGIDRAQEDREEGEAVGYPGFAGFELEDGIYLLGPLTWLGFLQPFFVAAGIGAALYCLWTLWRLVRLSHSGRG